MAQPDYQHVDVNSMVRLLVTGDSQSCGRNLAIDFPQLLSHRLPVRVINTAVGGSNSSALLYPMQGGTLKVKAGEKLVYGTNVRWGMGPFPGCHIVINGRRYTIDYIVEHPHTPETEIGLLNPASETYEGTEYCIDPCWEDRVTSFQPDVVVLMYINDGAMAEKKKGDWREMIRRIRETGAVPILMSPVPVDDTDMGGNHPGDNTNVARNAAAIAEIAESEKCWFIDVYHLTRALDPPLRCVVRDGIHPDTDGQTVITDGLMWVFEQMGLVTAKPSIEGWVLEEKIPENLAAAQPAERPFRCAQPDHPTPDRQQTEGFTIDAFHRNDEYTLISKAEDGYALETKRGIRLRVAFSGEAPLKDVTLRLVGNGIDEAWLRSTPENQWKSTQIRRMNGQLQFTIPGGNLHNNSFEILLGTEETMSIDYIVASAKCPPAEKWAPIPSVFPSAYSVESEHAAPDNLVTNSNFTASDAGWKLTGNATVNAPFTAEIQEITIPESNDHRLITVSTDIPIRPYDLLTIRDSKIGNDGNFRVRSNLGEGKLHVRKLPKRPEDGLGATLTHNDGCGLVPGGCCLELPQEGEAIAEFTLPPGTDALRFSFFHRAYEPDKLGTRDIPRGDTSCRIVFIRAAADTFSTIPMDAEPSYQWRKSTMLAPVPEDAEKARIHFSGTDGSIRQITGVAAIPVDRPK